MSPRPNAVPATSTASPSRTHGQIGTIVLLLGGHGLKAGELIIAQVRTWIGSRLIIFVAVDTDQSEPSSADMRLNLALSNEEWEELKACPASFGPAIPEAVEACADLLFPAEQRSGARTCPMMTQLSFAYKIPEFCRVMSEAINRIKAQAAVANVRILAVGGNAGGTARALEILIPLALADWEIRTRILAGCEVEMLEPPTVIAASPYATARIVPDLHQDKILGNLYGWEHEMDEMLRRQYVLYCFLIGYTNARGNALISKSMVVRVLATATVQLLKHYDHVKSRIVDTMPAPRRSTYTGDDLPELRYPSLRHLW